MRTAYRILQIPHGHMIFFSAEATFHTAERFFTLQSNGRKDPGGDADMSLY